MCPGHTYTLCICISRRVAASNSQAVRCACFCLFSSAPRLLLRNRGPARPSSQQDGQLQFTTCSAGTNVGADGHTASNAPDLFRPPKLSGAGPGQYWGGGPPGKTLGYCQLFLVACVCAAGPNCARHRTAAAAGRPPRPRAVRRAAAIVPLCSAAPRWGGTVVCGTPNLPIPRALTRTVGARHGRGHACAVGASAARHGCGGMRRITIGVACTARLCCHEGLWCVRFR